MNPAIPWRWRTQVDAATANEWSQALNGAPLAVARALAARGAPDPDAWRGQRLSETLADLGTPDETIAAAAVLAGLAARGPIAILCDYDVDGGASQAILAEAIATLRPGEPVTVTVPHRNQEGFGPNERCLREAADAGATGIVILDCGTNAGPLLDRFAHERDLTPVVLDHHRSAARDHPEEGLLANPHSRPNGAGRHANLCTGALALMVAGRITQFTVPDLIERQRLLRRWVGLAALATVCDVMPLDDFNRSLIRTGTTAWQNPANIPTGVHALMDVAKITPASLEPSDFGWRVGPRINAGSRMGASDLAAKCLRETHEPTAAGLATQLDDYNTARRTASDTLSRKLIANGYEHDNYGAGPISVGFDDKSHPGVAGLAASALVREFGWPAIVLAPESDANGVMRLAGSGRSALGFDLGTSVSQAVDEGIATRGGGHPAACGLTLQTPTGNEHEAVAKLRAFITNRICDAGGLEGPEVVIDAALKGLDLAPHEAMRIADALDQLAPFGPNAEAPRFGLRNARAESTRRTKTGEHLKVRINVDGVRADLMWWRAPATAEQTLGTTPNAQGGASQGPNRTFDAIVRLERDDWPHGPGYRLTAVDVRPSHQ